MLVIKCKNVFWTFFGITFHEYFCIRLYYFAPVTDKNTPDKQKIKQINRKWLKRFVDHMINILWSLMKLKVITVYNSIPRGFISK